MTNSFKYYFNKFLQLFIGGLILLSVIIFGVSQEWFGELPTIEFIKNPQNQISSVIYTEDYEVMGKLYYENRTELNYKQISPNTINALIATEDVRFYEHSGIDVYGLMTAIMRTMMGKPSGASTISQQLAKNLFHNTGKKNKLVRMMQKFKEWYIAVELERNFSKQEILALYFNTVPFLHNAFGIREAAQTYYSKEPINLTLDESATLVGMLKGPGLYNPKTRPENAKNRRNVVLGLMAKNEFINEKTAEAAKKLPISLNYKLTSPSTGLAPYLREQIRMELGEILNKYSKPNGEAYNIYSDGLKIYTTINSKLQTYAEEAVNEHMPWLQSQFLKEWKGKDPYKYGSKANPDLIKNIVKESEAYLTLSDQGKSEKEIFEILSTEKHSMRIFTWKGPRDTSMSFIDSIKYMKKIIQVGLCAMDPRTGRIKAWVGGIDFNYFKLDHVRKSTKRQVGSTIKPLLYDLAIEAGETPCSTIEYSKPLIPGHEKWDPKGTKFFIDGSQVSLKDGLQVSDNRVAAQLIKKYGSQALIEKAKQLGIESDFEDGPAICLGTTDVSVIEMLGAYSPFMNSGIYSMPYYIERIEDKNGNIIYQNTPQSKEVIAEDAAKLMNIMMQQVSQDRGTASRLRKQYGFKGEIACKTGTTQSNSDGWFIGSTPSLLTAVWVGADDPSITFASTGLGQGASSALPVWGKFYQKAHKDPSTRITQVKSFFSETDSAVLQKFDCNFQPQFLVDPNMDVIIDDQPEKSATDYSQ
jgi:penicillin-binding protein 1A